MDQQTDWAVEDCSQERRRIEAEEVEGRSVQAAEERSKYAMKDGHVLQKAEEAEGESTTTSSCRQQRLAVVNINKCFKCSGAFKFEDTAAGCDRCPRWFHLRCVPEDVQAMEDDLENAKFECDFCGSPETCSSEWD